MGNAYRKGFHIKRHCILFFSLYIGVAFQGKKPSEKHQKERRTKTLMDNKVMNSFDVSYAEQGALYSFKLEEIAAKGPLFSDDEEYIPDPQLQ